jgi:lipoyl(octanoyl) transferase
MRRFTDTRDAATDDALWLAEHPPVFTQGQAGRAEHLLAPGDIPVVQTDRGGQVTYHGPGQTIAYVLVDLRRLRIGVRALVNALEAAVVELLAGLSVPARPQPNAPGVYVDGAKIASVGLRVRHGCSYHGIALNVGLDLAPFERINPCGYPGLAMTRLVDLVPEGALAGVDIGGQLATGIARQLGLRLATVSGCAGPVHQVRGASEAGSGDVRVIRPPR